MPKYPTSNAVAAVGTHGQHSQSASLPAASSARTNDAEANKCEENDVTEPLTGKRTPWVTCMRPYYAAAVVVLQLLTSDLWIEVLKPFGGLRSRCPDLKTLGIDSDDALLAALHEHWRPDVVESRDEQSSWTAALKQCTRAAFIKLMAAVSEGWLSPLTFDRDGNTIMHIALRCSDSRALCFLDGQVYKFYTRFMNRVH